MRLNYTIAPFLIGAMLFMGCSHIEYSVSEKNVTLSSSTTHSLPSWVFLPSINGKIGGVGISKIHIDGKTAQRELAIHRALDEIARQMSVNVSSIQKINTYGTKDYTTTTVESYSFQTTQGQNVKAIIKEFWYDENKDELYVWMVCE